MPPRLLLATNNPHKLQEFRQMLSTLDIEAVSPRDIDLQLDVDETGESFAENAVLKAEAFSAASGYLTLSDDSGLVVDALGGAPGVYSARYGGPGLDDQGRTSLLLSRMDGIPEGRRQARFVAAIAIAGVRVSTRVVEGRVEGTITREVMGSRGFGYDPVFYHPPSRCTFAELSREQKAVVSHRGRALALAIDALHDIAAADILGRQRGKYRNDQSHN